MSAEVELVLDARAELGEGPVWDEAGQQLVWVDIMAGRVHLFRPQTGACRSLDVGRPVGAVALSTRGGLVLAVPEGFIRLDLDTGALAPLAALPAPSPDIRMNDGTCDRAGRFWAGTLAKDERAGAGALYRLDPAGTVTVVLEGVTISNGLDWSLDERRMYYIDSGTRRIDVFDWDLKKGQLSNRRPFVPFPVQAGIPDGLTLDADGGVWVALWGGGALHRYRPDGHLDRVVLLPVTHPTSCAFGGPDLRDLFVTSASVALGPDERARQPGAGGVFRVRPGVRGRLPNTFGD
jgi:sugar lactone lactonase YvrE